MATLNRKPKGRKDSLPGFQISQRKMMGRYPVIEPAIGPKNMVSGMVYKVSYVELYKIDQYETKAYKRIQLTLKSGVLAWVYVENLD